MVENKIICVHCGDVCDSKNIRIGENYFCCEGCKLVYEILNENNLCNYYDINSNPGIKTAPVGKKKYEYLDDETIIRQLLDFSNDDISVVTFNIPQMHCSSCIWLLENLYRIHKSVVKSQVNFISKRAVITFRNKEISLRQVVELLASIGYGPSLKYENLEKKKIEDTNKKLYYKVGITGFCLGNIMLFSFPEYLSIDASSIALQKVFTVLNVIISLPVFFYSASDYFISAFKGIRKKYLNLDVPVSLGIITIYFKSLYDISTGIGPGYMDTLTGLVFLLLVGRLYQNKVYERFNFERDYKSFFPLSVTQFDKGIEKVIPLTRVKTGDKLVIRNGELIPADGILYKGDAEIDYSFITGEWDPVKKNKGEILYAGGKQNKGKIEIEVVKEVSASYLSQLWNNDAFKKSKESAGHSFANKVSYYFTPAILILSAATFIFWLNVSFEAAMNSATSLLIIACPCGLALTSPFTLGNTLRIFGKMGFYLKNTSVIERMTKIDTIVFDKTGTITQKSVNPGSSGVKFNTSLNNEESILVKSLLKNSTHPLSLRIYHTFNPEIPLLDVEDYNEIPGEGIEGKISGRYVKLGKRSFVYQEAYDKETENITVVFLSIDGILRGNYSIDNSYRKGLRSLIDSLSDKYKLLLITGDNDGEKGTLLTYFQKEDNLHFNMSPIAKIEYIKSLHNSGHETLMIGDGLNDAGALKASSVGVAISEDKAFFTPSSDAILDADSFNYVDKFLAFSRTAENIIYTSFIISAIYNSIGVVLAFNNIVTPLMSAILMPLSSITVVVFTVTSTNLMARLRLQ
ncbi:MAG TPA: heavy metal translocating P-type ATPase metal-binding domain-containing protein [Ignavibacteriaceae bacterium]|nr:heavy metal translocating P-type ATPase metal-binding domain-containing protein [Ignavibacteriaceae bacterium]